MLAATVKVHHCDLMVSVTAVPTIAPRQEMVARHNGVIRQDLPVSLKRQTRQLCEAPPSFPTARLVELVQEQLGPRPLASSLRGVLRE